MQARERRIVLAAAIALQAGKQEALADDRTEQSDDDWEGEAHALKAWDFLHGPAWTRHAFANTGDEPCALLMVGARRDGVEPDCEYPVEPKAQRLGAGVTTATTVPDEAYAGTPDSVDEPDREKTLPGA